MSNINNMELGNLLFGNSRGSYEVPRNLVNCNEWQELMHFLIQVEDYHCCIGEYYEDYSDARLEYKSRTSPIPKDEYGGCTLEVDGKVIFKLFPYWWGDCTCGVEEENEKLYKKWEKEIFTKEEFDTYMSFEDWCNEECPACTWLDNNKNKTQKELLKLCTCGSIKKNIELKKKKKLLQNKIKIYEDHERNDLLSHKNDCALIIPNFIYHPGQEDEFYINWYKYPFRDSYMNRDLCEKEIKEIFQDCINQFKLKYK